MNAITYFLNSYNWSFTGLFCSVLVLLCYIWAWKTSAIQKTLFFVALVLIYLVLGSPIANLESFGLHSVTMLQQIVLLMISPILILKSLPHSIFDSAFFNKLSLFNHPKKYFMATWILGSLTMWCGHFLSAAITSSKYGVVICGISAPANSWFTHIPQVAIYGLLFVAGFLFALPVFHPNRTKRLHPVKSVIYLFTACVSCATLGLYVTFMASSAAMAEVIPAFYIFRNPFPMSVKTDQELAGLMMWVPGCILYVIASVELLLPWYDENPVSNEKQLLKMPVSDK